MQDLLSQKFAALADPTRRAMLKRLSTGNANVTEIAEPFLGQMSLPAVTKHLKVLEKAGLITKTQDAQRRLCGLNPQGFQDPIQFMEHYRQLAEESLDRLGEYLKTVTAKSQATATPSTAKSMSRSSIKVKRRATNSPPVQRQKQAKRSKKSAGKKQ